MKSIKNLLVLAVFITVFIVGCKKTNTQNLPTAAKIKTLQYLQSTTSDTSGTEYGSESLVYDQQGRLILDQSFDMNGNPNGHITYSYTNSTFTNIYYGYSGPEPIDTYFFQLNSLGYICDDKFNSTYNYNSAGNLVYEKDNGSTGTYNYTYTGGNLVYATYTFINDSLSNHSDNNTYLSVIDTRDKGLAPFGKQSTNLMSNTLRALYNGTQQTITYTYLYDNLGRVSRQTQVQRNVGSSSFVTTICNYTYY